MFIEILISLKVVYLSLSNILGYGKNYVIIDNINRHFLKLIIYNIEYIVMRLIIRIEIMN